MVAGRITNGRMGGRLDDGGAAGCGEPPSAQNGVNTEGLVADPAHVVAPAAAPAADSAAPPAATVPIPIRAAGCTRGLGGPRDRTGVDGVCNARMGPCRQGLPPPPSVPLPPADPSTPRLSQRPGEESAPGCRAGNGPSGCGGRGGGVDGVTVVGTTRKVCAAIPGDDDDVPADGVDAPPGGSTRNTAVRRPATGGSIVGDDGGARDARLARLGGDTTAAPPTSSTRRTPRADTGGGDHLGSDDGDPPLPKLPPPHPHPPRMPPQPAQR